MGISDAAVLLIAALGPVAVLWQARPAVMARRGRNAWIGLRTAATMRSEAAWVAGHEAAWPLMRVASIVSLLVLAATVTAGRAARAVDDE